MCPQPSILSFQDVCCCSAVHRWYQTHSVETIAGILHCLIHKHAQVCRSQWIPKSLRVAVRIWYSSYTSMGIFGLHDAMICISRPFTLYWLSVSVSEAEITPFYEQVEVAEADCQVIAGSLDGWQRTAIVHVCSHNVQLGLAELSRYNGQSAGISQQNWTKSKW